MIILRLLKFSSRFYICFQEPVFFIQAKQHSFQVILKLQTHLPLDVHKDYRRIKRLGSLLAPFSNQTMNVQGTSRQSMIYFNRACTVSLPSAPPTFFPCLLPLTSFPFLDFLSTVTKELSHKCLMSNSRL